MQDQRFALQWVQRNIHLFGGSSKRVMIFGESAGAGSVGVHLSMPKSAELFAAAVAESGAFASWSAKPM